MKSVVKGLTIIVIIIVIILGGLYLIQNIMADKSPMNILVIGSDVKVKENDPVRTDTIMIVNYNPKTSETKILSIPRDFKAVYNNKTMKINAIYASSGEGENGIEQLQSYLSEIFKIDIKYYVMVNTSALKEVVDAVGGVEYNVPADLYYNDPTQNLHINLKKGIQVLDGDKAEQLLRFRKPEAGQKLSQDAFKIYYNSDFGRISVQQDFIKELIKQKANLASIIHLPNIIGIINENVKTNLGIANLSYLALNFKYDKNKMTSYRVNGQFKNINGEEYVLYDNSLYDTSKNTTVPADSILELFRNLN